MGRTTTNEQQGLSHLGKVVKYIRLVYAKMLRTATEHVCNFFQKKYCILCEIFRFKVVGLLRHLGRTFYSTVLVLRQTIELISSDVSSHLGL